MTSEQHAAAMKRWEEGDLGGAAVLFREIAATGDPEASHLLACLLEEQGDLDGAEAAHRSVILSGDPVFGQRSAISMGMMLVAAREWPAAYRVLTIAADGADFEVAALADTALVLVLTELGDVSGAEEALERARRCDSPAVAELAARLELPVFEWADPRTAWELYEEAEGEEDYRELLTCGDPEVVSLSAFRLYRIHAEEGDFAAAREACEHAIAVGHPGHLTMAYKLLGAVLVDLGEYAESVEAYARAAEDPRPEVRLPALIEQAKVFAQLGDMAATRAIFERVIASGQREHALEARACLAQLHTEAGEVEEALAALRAVFAAGESPWASVSATLLGMLLEQHPERREAIVELAGEIAGHPDPDAAFKAGLLLDHDARQRPLADPVEERALRDVDDALLLLQDGRLAEARRMLRRAADSGARTQAVRAMVALAQLELAEGDRDQADELLSYVAEGEDVVGGFTAAFMLHLLCSSGNALHPVLRAVLDHQRLGREEGLIGYRAAMEDADPAVAAIATAVFAQVLVTTGYDVSEAGTLFRSAAGSGDPLALSYAALVFREVLESRGEAAEAIELLRRARAEGHPALAPWVGYALGGLLDGHERHLGEARAAYGAAMETRHRGLRAEAAGALLGVYEVQGDLLAAGRLHERMIAESRPGQAARHALLLGLTRVRLDDLTGARAAFDLVEGDEQAVLGRYARCLLDGDLDAAGEALAALAGGSGDGGWPLATLLGLECAHAWRRAGAVSRADAVLSLLVEGGHREYRWQAACHLGALRDDAGDHRGALAAWERALADGQGSPVVALTGMGHALHRLGDLEAAAGVLSRALEGAGTGGAGRDVDGEGAVPAGEAAMRLAQVLAALGRAGEARELLEELDREAAPLYLAGFLRDGGDVAAALAVAEEAAGVVPGELAGQAARVLGSARAAAGDAEGARAAFDRAVELEPDLLGEILLERGHALAGAGDEAGARAAYRRAEEQGAGPLPLVARLRLGTATPEERPAALAADGDVEGALAALARLRADTASDPVLARADDLVLEVARGLGGEAGEALCRYVAEHGDPVRAARARIGLGAILSGEGHHCRAELCLLPVTGSGDPELAETAWRGIAAARRGRGDLPGAADALRHAMPATATTLAGVLEDLGDAEGTRRALAAGARAGDLESLRRLVVHLFWQEDYEAAVAEAERAVGTGDPETVALGYWVWGDSCQAVGDLRGAEIRYRQGIDTGFAGLTDSIRTDLAAVLHAMGDPAAAVREARLAVASGDPDAMARGGLRLGAWLREEGDLSGAAEAFAAAAGTPTALARTALDELEAMARRAHGAGDHAQAVRVLALMGEGGAAPARELGASCEDAEAVRSYYELTGSGPLAELDVAERLAGLGRTAEARAVFERLNEHEDPDVRFVAGGRLLTLLDAEGDSDAFYSLAERQAGDAESPVPGVFGSLLGMLQERQGDTEAALRTLRAAAGTGEATALSVLGQALVAAGEVDEGREVYRRVLDAGDPGLAARAMIAIGRTYHDEDEAEARAWYLRALDAENGLTGGPAGGFTDGHADGRTAALAAMYLGALAKRARDFPEALGWYQRVIDAGDTESGMAAAHLGELCYWLGDRDGALRYYELTLTLTDRPDLVAEAAFRLGEIQHAHGDVGMARRMLELAVATEDPAFARQAAELLAKIG
ncbi:tetratricopeptide repeat protein [Nonomuraea sp. 3-1Str]|uniref:tetratricopeptide repeat protein n=1 Tax=Nonomuraea sp. 3-1Str TaxID=2929801 RepID=UPI002856AA74|nr:tetratricopeptide repeat protein [Nonomuraea sp. 3-1Str]MDR8410327.1 tetratricopeptide repeat protein [Nonomuraea sp. 3-1Str]